MESQDYLLYAVLALIIIGIIMFVIYKTNSTSEKFSAVEKVKEKHDMMKQSTESTLDKEDFTNITECPCVDMAADCPLGCSCSACSREPFGHEEESLPIYLNMTTSSQGTGGAILKNTVGAGIRGDVPITSAALSKSLNVPRQKSLTLDRGAKNIVF